MKVINVGRCKICNFSDDTDQHNGNKMLDHETCLECTEVVGDTMSSYYWEDMDSDDLSWLFDKEELESPPTMPVPAPQKPVQGDPEVEGTHAHPFLQRPSLPPWSD